MSTGELASLSPAAAWAAASVEDRSARGCPTRGLKSEALIEAPDAHVEDWGAGEPEKCVGDWCTRGIPKQEALVDLGSQRYCRLLIRRPYLKSDILVEFFYIIFAQFDSSLNFRIKLVTGPSRENWIRVLRRELEFLRSEQACFFEDRFKSILEN